MAKDKAAEKAKQKAKQKAAEERLRKARKKLERFKGDKLFTPEFQRCNREVAAAEKAVPWWRR